MKDKIFSKFKKIYCEKYILSGISPSDVTLASEPYIASKGLCLQVDDISNIILEIAQEFNITIDDNLDDFRFDTVQGIVDYIYYKATHKETVLDRQLKMLFDDSVPGEKFSSFASFMASETTLSNRVRNEFAQGKKCVWTKIQHDLFQAMAQMTFKGKDGKFYNVYVGFLYTTFCVMANITEHHSKVMRKYGKWWDGDLCLNTGASRSKVPLFTKIFEERQNLGKPYFMPDRNQVLIAQQVNNDAFQEDKDFYNLVGGILTICQSLINEIEGANLDKYSFADDLKAALRVYLLLN